MSNADEADATYEERIARARHCTHCGEGTRRPPMTLFNTCAELRGRFAPAVGAQLCTGHFCSFECMLGNACSAAVAASDYALVEATIRATAGYLVEPARLQHGHGRAQMRAVARMRLSPSDAERAREWDYNYVVGAEEMDMRHGALVRVTAP